ncbi:MAG: ABC transporter ATP-binding protein [Candidatus Omnitrophota bacterium]
MEKEVIIKVENITKILGGRRVLDGVNLDIRKGETTVIMGGSGCGKSTLLRNMVGVLTPDEGRICIKEKDITQISSREMDEMRKKFGMLFQGAALFDSMSVFENIALPLREHTKLAEHIIKIMVKMKLELVGLGGFENYMPAQLSGGMKKRVGLARAIAMDPEILFCDEPTAGLDPVVGGAIDKLISDLTNKLDITCIVVTHDMNSVFRIADSIAMLYKGKILQVGTPDEIKNTKNETVRQFINGSPEGPIRFMDAGDDYLQRLTEGEMT